MKQTQLRDVLVAVSLANLLFLKAWIEIFEGVRHPYFRADAGLYWADCAAVALDVLLAAGVFWGGVVWARRSRRSWALPLARGAFLIVFLLMSFIVLNVMRRRFPALSPDSLAATLGAPLLVVFGLGLLALLFYARAHLVTAVMVVVLIFSPFAAITFAQAVWLGLRHSPTPATVQGTPVKPVPARDPSRSRVLWFIFDDMDYRLAFPERPQGIDLPEFDRLRSESLFATRVEPPAGYTGRSLPGLVTGRRVALARPASLNELVLTFEDGPHPVGWSSQPSVFSLAHGAGFTTGVVGWYHPYCRLFGSSLTYCAWEPFNAAESAYPVAKSMLEFARMTAPPFVRGLFDRMGIKDPDLNARYHLGSYRRISSRAQEVIVDTRLDLTLIHLPVPHPPTIYDRRKQELTLAGDTLEGYLDNLVLADRTLGELRRTLEAAGQWEGVILLVSSDHPWRDSNKFDGKRDPRVPFLLKLSGQKEGLVFDVPFNSVVTRDLLLALLQGGLPTPESAAAWLEARAATQVQ